INSGGATGANDFEEAVTTAVINKRAGGTGLISGRKAFQRPMKEGVQLLNAIQDVYLSPDVTVAYRRALWRPTSAELSSLEWGDSREGQARVSVAARAASNNLFAFSRMSPLPNTALPATSSSAPARTMSPSVSSATPPSISIRKDSPSDSRTSARVLTLWSAPGINFCAPNPGFTDMIKTWCAMSNTSSTMCTGVAGFRTTAGLHPYDSISCSVR